MNQSNNMLVNTVAMRLGITVDQLFRVVCQNLDMTQLTSQVQAAFEETGRLPVRVHDYLKSLVPTEEEMCKAS